MTTHFHLIVEKTHDLDDVRIDRPVQDDVSPAPSVPRDVDRPQAWPDLITPRAPEKIWPRAEFRDRLDEGRSIRARLALAESVNRPLEDRAEVVLGLATEANSPSGRTVRAKARQRVQTGRSSTQ